MVVVPLPLPSPLNNLLLVNWTSRVSMSCSFQTAVSASRDDGAEDRAGLIDKPARELTVTFTGMDKNRSTQLWMNLARFADQRGIQPLYQDETVTTIDTVDRFDGPLQVNVTDITCPTDLQRFSVGGRIMIAEVDAENITKLEVGTLVYAVSGLLTVLDLANDFSAGASVFPLMDVEVELKGSGRFKTGEVFSVRVKSKEVVGMSALDRTLTSLPPVQTHEGLPIFSTPYDWGRSIKSSVVRAGRVSKQGKGKTVNIRESRPRFIHDLVVRDERAELWTAIQFFDWAVGRKKEFWLVAPNVTYTPVSISTTQIAVVPLGLLEDHEDFLENIAIVQTDGTILIRGIASIVLVSDEWIITFDAVIPSITLADIDYSTPAHRVRFRKDSYKEDWSTTNFGEIRMTFIDLLNEETVTITDIDPPDSEKHPGLLAISDFYFWMDASGPAWGTIGSGGAAANLRSIPYRMDRFHLTYPIPADVIGGGAFLSTEEDIMFDARQAPRDNSLIEPYLSRAARTNTGGFNVDPTSRPTLALWDHETQNNGLPTNYHFGIRNAISRRTIGWQLQNSDAAFWDDTEGLTIFVCVLLGGDTFEDTDLLFMSRAGVFEWQSGVVRFFETVDVPVANHVINYTQPNNSETWILAVRWVPSSVADVYINGGAPEASAAIAPASINATARGTFALSMRPNVFGGGGGDPQDIDSNQERHHFSNALLVFKRGLSIAEMDVVGNYLANRYNAIWDAAS